MRPFYFLWYNILMMKENIFILYLQWHFVDASKDVLKAWQNYLKFNLNYWSTPLLLKTLFSPWRKHGYSYGKGFNLRRYFEAFSFNMVSRSMGFIMRSFLIVFGVFTEVFVFFAGGVVFLIWIILPFFLILGVFYGFKAFF